MPEADPSIAGLLSPQGLDLRSTDFPPFRPLPASFLRLDVASEVIASTKLADLSPGGVSQETGGDMFEYS